MSGPTDPALRALLDQAYTNGFIDGQRGAALAAAEAAPLDVREGHGVSGLFHHEPGASCVVCDRHAEAAPLDANGDRPLGYYEAEAAPLDVERLAEAAHPHLLGSHGHSWAECDSQPWVRLEVQTMLDTYAALRSPDTERRVGAIDRRVGPGDDLPNLHERRSKHRRKGDYERRVLGRSPDTETAERDWKRGPCAHGNPCRDSDCVEYGRWDTETRETS